MLQSKLEKQPLTLKDGQSRTLHFGNPWLGTVSLRVQLARSGDSLKMRVIERAARGAAEDREFEFQEVSRGLAPAFLLASGQIPKGKEPRTTLILETAYPPTPRK